jgi:uncharacterized membrane protein
MQISHILNANILVRAHIALAVIGVVLGAWQLFSKKGTNSHRVLGWVWVFIMASVGISALFLPERKQNIIPITMLLTLWVAIALPLGVMAIKKGNIMLHRAYMMGLYIGGLFIALAFTITPGRLLYKVIFGQ